MAAPMCFRSLTNLCRISRQTLFRATPNRTDSYRYLSNSTNTEKKADAETSSSAETEKTVQKSGQNNADDANQTELLELKEKLTKENEKLTTDFKEMKDKYMRALAETENVRTRMKKQVEDTKLFGIQGFCKDMLEVADILNQATETVPEDELKNNQHLKSLFDGLVMTNQQIVKTFSKHGLVKIEPVIGEKFDPFFHEALFQAPAQGDSKPDTIADIQKTGYKLHDRTLRPALVGVFKS